MIPITTPYLHGGRELCITGACILTASSDWLGRVIRFFEGDHAFCSHAAAIVRGPDDTGRDRVNVSLIESLEDGPTKTYLSSYFTGFNGRLFLFQPTGLTPEIQAAFAAFLDGLVADHVHYDYAGLLANIVGHEKEVPPGQQIKDCICSAEVGYGWERNGLPRMPSAPRDVVPQPPDLPSWWAGEPVVELVGPFV
jgi:hypothetical protein